MALREWSAPKPAGNVAQLEFAGCKRVEVGPIINELVTYWTKRFEEGGASRDFYLKAKRAGEQFLVSIGWRYLPARSTPDPERLPTHTARSTLDVLPPFRASCT
jgi:hypothetical protein